MYVFLSHVPLQWEISVFWPQVSTETALETIRQMPIVNVYDYRKEVAGEWNVEVELGDVMPHRAVVDNGQYFTVVDVFFPGFFLVDFSEQEKLLYTSIAAIQGLADVVDNTMLKVDVAKRYLETVTRNKCFL